ncbi:hypothetical protein V9T40_001025 [Parthenolecanium corni]|uniref:Seipin n=1 Tax=Parthenolecanium corni TaxID=536013 RepID=A0AAN9TRI8_9HEMI
MLMCFLFTVYAVYMMGLKMWVRRAFMRRITVGKQSVKRIVDNSMEQAFHGGMFSLIMTSLVWISIFLYVAFYYAYVPAPSYVRPIHLQIKPCEESKNECVFPSAYVRLTRRHQLLMMGQQYKFFVQLEMPESPVNKDLGMFMVCVQLKDKHGVLSSQSCRSNMLHYRSDLLHKLKLLLFSPLYIFGSREEKQSLIFELYSDFVEDQKHPVTDIYVEVQARNIEIYSASLQINAHLVGLRYLMYHWPITSAITGISFNLCVIFFTLSLSFYNNFFVDSGASSSASPEKVAKIPDVQETSETVGKTEDVIVKAEPNSDPSEDDEKA